MRQRGGRNGPYAGLSFRRRGQDHGAGFQFVFALEIEVGDGESGEFGVGVADSEAVFNAICAAAPRIANAAGEWGALPFEAKVEKGENLFPRIDASRELEELAKLAAPAKDPIEPFKENVVFDDFLKCDFRVCKVLKCEAVKKSQKLLRFELDDGSGVTRQILSGIAQYYKP